MEKSSKREFLRAQLEEYSGRLIYGTCLVFFGVVGLVYRDEIRTFLGL